MMPSCAHRGCALINPSRLVSHSARILKVSRYSFLTSSSPSRDEDSFCKTAMSRREDIVSCIDVTIMDRSAHSALPSSYSKIFPAFGAGAAITLAAGAVRVASPRRPEGQRLSRGNRMRRRALGLLMLAGLSAGSAAPVASDLDTVMSLLAMRRHGRVEFVEQKFLAILSRPVESSGELLYDAPDRLEKRTLLPRAETLVLAGSKLTMQRGGHACVLDLRRYPQIQPFVESIRATLAGDRGALEQVFHVEFAGNVRRWSLTLTPLDRQLSRAVKQVEIDGSQDQLLRVEIRQTDGDRSLMTLRSPATP